MNRDECSADWYRRQRQPVSGRQPRFVTSGGYSVRAISLDGVAQYQIMRGPYLVAYARDIGQLAEYVDLAELQLETS